MDTCDGVFAPVGPERRLEIMRDSHVGSFGVAAAGLVLLGKYAALASLGDAPRGAALIAMAVLGRWAMTLAAVAFPAGRSEGLGRLIKDGARKSDLVLAGGLAAAVCVTVLSWAGGLLFVGLSTLAWLTARALAAQLNGLTGDSYGALDELSELLALALLPPCLRLAVGLSGLL
jgi:adenosylcobinamide-GDP ribazoletransferase